MKIARINNQPYQLLDAHSAAPITNFTTVLAAQAAGEAAWQLGKARSISVTELQAPISQPSQVFAIGMNYADHSKEIHMALPKTPSIFTKFPSAVTGPTTRVQLHGPRTDWETELVVVIGVGGRNIAKEEAAKHIAGYMVGEDLSDRDVQFANDPAQFSLGKSFADFAPIGPWLTTPDEVADRDALTITTTVNGKVMQHAPLSQMVFGPEDLIAYLSGIVALRPGDLIFTGTPMGTGVGHKPALFLHAGDQVEGRIDGLGSLHMSFSE